MKLILSFLLGAALAVAALADPPAVTFKQLRTISGKEYTEVAVTAILPNSIRITHDSGTATVHLADLSPDLQKQFGYDSAKADAFSKSQDEQAGAAKARNQVNASMARLGKIVQESKLHVLLKIVQVLQDGVLAQSSEVGAHDAVIGTVFVVCPTALYVDGSALEGNIYQAGTYVYTNTLGARATVRKYATAPEKALSLLLEEGLNDDSKQKLDLLLNPKR